MQHKDLSWLTSRPIAHRGLHNLAERIVENCQQAFEAAAKRNFSIELDVQVTKDGRAAVFHDYVLDRLTTGDGQVDQLTLEELKQFTFRNGDDRIQDLSTILEQVAGRVPLVIELKAPNVQDGRLEKAVAACLEDYSGLAACMSFSPMVVSNLHSLTDRPCGIVSVDYFRDKAGKQFDEAKRYYLTHMLHAAETKPDFISYCVKDLPSPASDLMKALFDIPVICWTSKSVEDHIEALKHCDQVTFEGYDPDAIS